MLTGKQKRYLRSLGNELEPILILGKGGITPNVIAQANEALAAREIIKGRVLPNCLENTGVISAELASQVRAELVQVIGRNFLLYRRADKNEKVKIILPD